MSDRAKFNIWHYNIDGTINSINNDISNLATKEATDIANVNRDIANVRKEHAADVSNINNDIANINIELDEVVHFNDPTSLIILDKLEGAIEKSSADAGTTYEKNGSSISTSGAKNSDIITIDATSTIINQHNAANTTFTSTGIVFTDSAKKTHTVMYDDTTKAITDAINNIVATETTNRIAAVNAANDNLNAEEKARLAATNAINTTLDAESKARLAATNAINSSLTAETNARTAATNAINSSFNSAKVVRYTVDSAGQANLKFLADDTINDAVLTLADERGSSLLEILPNSAGLYSEAVTDTITDNIGIFACQTIDKSEVAMEEDWTEDGRNYHARIGIEDGMIRATTIDREDSITHTTAISANLDGISMTTNKTESGKATKSSINSADGTIALDVSNSAAGNVASLCVYTGKNSGVHGTFYDSNPIQCTENVKKIYTAASSTLNDTGFSKELSFGVDDSRRGTWPTEISFCGGFDASKVSETATDFLGNYEPFANALYTRLEVGYGEDGHGASLVFDCNDLLHGAHYDSNTGLVRYDKYITDGADSLNIGPYSTSENATYYPTYFGDGSIHVEGSASTDSYTGWYIDATNGKFATNSSSWIQVNANTIMYIPVDYYSGVSGTITIKSYSDVPANLFNSDSGTITITNSGVSIDFVEGQLTKLNGKYYIKLTYLGNNYLGTTTVAYTANDYKVKLNADGVTTSELTADRATINSLQASIISALPRAEDYEFVGTIGLRGGRSLSEVIIQADGDTYYSGDRGAVYIDTNMARLYATKEFTLSNSYNNSYGSPVDPTITISYDKATPMLNIWGQNSTVSSDNYGIYAGPSRGDTNNYSSITAEASGELHLSGHGKNTTRTGSTVGVITLGVPHSLGNYTDNISVNIFADETNYIRVGDGYVGTKAAKGYIFETDKGTGKYDHETLTFTLANGKTVTRTILTSTDFIEK